MMGLELLQSWDRHIQGLSSISSGEVAASLAPTSGPLGSKLPLEEAGGIQGQAAEVMGEHSGKPEALVGMPGKGWEGS